MADPLSERYSKAVAKMTAADAVLGFQGSFLVRQVLGQRKTIQEVSMSLGLTSQREFNYMSRRFRECLESLAKHWGFAG